MKQFVQFAVLSLAMLWDYRCEGAYLKVKLCGRDLGDFMSSICHTYNSPAWDVPTVVEQPAAVVRRKRQTGIADECCIHGCTLQHLTSYCSISAKSESPFDSMEAHMIADRSTGEQAMVAPAAVGHSGTKAEDGAGTKAGARREVGRGRSRGYGRARGRRCWCARKRRSGHRRSSLMGNMDIKNVARAAPVLGTVSPLLTWGRTLNTELPTADRDRYAYIAVYK